MKVSKNISLLLPLVLLGGFAGIWKLQLRIDAQRTAHHEEEDEVLVRSGKFLKIMSLGYAPLVAAIYWTRTVQYYGNKKVNQDTNLSSLWPLLDVTTTLDPNLIPPYRFGSTFLAEPQPRGAGRPDLAIELLRRGIRANPDYWRLYEDLGFVYYFDLKDYRKASQAFFRGSENPKAMIWMKIMAARIAEEGESRETSRFLWSEIFNSTKDKMVKENARVHLMLLRSDDDIAQLNRLAAEYAMKTGHPPVDERQLAEAGLLRGLLSDPQGYVYVFGLDGTAHLNPASPLAKELPLYRRQM